MQHVFSEYDVLFSTSILAKPGKQGFFLVYKYDKYDKDRVLKAHYDANIPMRGHQIAHHNVLAKIKQKETDEQREARRDKNYYFDIFQGYGLSLEVAALSAALNTDTQYWETPYTPQLQIVGQSGYENLTTILNKHVQTIMVLFKRLQCSSESFPALSYKCISDWVQQIMLVNEEYPIGKFSKDFSALKVEQKKAAPQRRRAGSLRSRRDSIVSTGSVKMQSSFKNKKDEQGDDSKFPSHSLSRHQFFDLIVKMAEGRFERQDDKIQPSVQVNRLIKDVILPSFQNGKLYKNPDETLIWLQTELLPNREIQKFLFLNQFNLKKVYDKILEEETKKKFDAQLEEVKKNKRKKSIRSTSFRSMAGAVGPGGLETLDADQEDASSLSPTKRKGLQAN